MGGMAWDGGRAGEQRRTRGAAMLGIGGDEIVHDLIDMMYAGAPCTTVQRAVPIHPTVSALIPTMLGDLRSLD